MGVYMEEVHEVGQAALASMRMPLSVPRTPQRVGVKRETQAQSLEGSPFLYHVSESSHVVPHEYGHE